MRRIPTMQDVSSDLQVRRAPPSSTLIATSPRGWDCRSIRSACCCTRRSAAVRSRRSTPPTTPIRSSSRPIRSTPTSTTSCAKCRSERQAVRWCRSTRWPSAATSPRRSRVNHIGQLPAVIISFNLATGVALGQAVEPTSMPRARGRPANHHHHSYEGSAQVFQQSVANQGMLLFAAVLVIYIVLGILYESFIHPLTILSGLPSAGIGALLTLDAVRHGSQRHRHDRHHHADRHRQEERHHDGRLRDRAARARAQRPSRRSSRLRCCASGRS